MPGCQSFGLPTDKQRQPGHSGILLCRLEATQSGAPLLSVNFDPELDKLLREVHDLLLMPSLALPVPEPALALYEHSELFRQQISALELVAEMHNNITATILPVESGLLQQQLHDVDACLLRGIEVGTVCNGCLRQQSVLLLKVGMAYVRHGTATIFIVHCLLKCLCCSLMHAPKLEYGNHSCLCLPCLPTILRADADAHVEQRQPGCIHD